jgi:paraquat-inducible protein A
MIACPECDALQQEPRRVPRGTSVHCWRCKMVLIRESRRGIDYVFSLIVTGSILFLIGNAFPLVSLEAQGNGVTTTLFGAVLHLWQQQMHLVSGLVFITTILAPAFDLSAMLYLTTGVMRVDSGRATEMPPLSARVLRAVQMVRPWGMLEVFMLGALVSIVKLGQMAAVVVGPALYSIGALILVLAAANSAFNPRDVWTRIPIGKDEEVTP